MFIIRIGFNGSINAAPQRRIHFKVLGGAHKVKFTFTLSIFFIKKTVVLQKILNNVKLSRHRTMAMK